MEKISNIVRGNSRVASTDLKAASAVRPGSPTFGRPVGESPASNERTETTASRANAIQNELNENKRAGGQDKTVSQMADSFFMSRIRNVEPEAGAPLPSTKGKPGAKEMSVTRERESESDAHEISAQHEALAKPEASSTDELMMGDTRNSEISQPMGYKPKGSFVDVRA